MAMLSGHTSTQNWPRDDTAGWNNGDSRCISGSKDLFPRLGAVKRSFWLEERIAHQIGSFLDRSVRGMAIVETVDGVLRALRFTQAKSMSNRLDSGAPPMVGFDKYQHQIACSITTCQIDCNLGNAGKIMMLDCCDVCLWRVVVLFCGVIVDDWFFKILSGQFFKETRLVGGINGTVLDDC